MSVQQLRQNGVQSAWSAQDLFFVAFEDLGTTERDFLIPLSSRLVGQTRNGDYFQDYIYTRFQKWIGGYYENMFSVNPMWSPEFKEF